MLGATAAGLYGFDLDALAPLAARYGPRVDRVSAGSDIPADSTSMAFEPRNVGVS